MNSKSLVRVPAQPFPLSEKVLKIKENVSPEHKNTNSNLRDVVFTCHALLSVLSGKSISEGYTGVVVVLDVIMIGISRLTEVERTTVVAIDNVMTA